VAWGRMMDLVTMYQKKKKKKKKKRTVVSA
jgi:hypothetical protein